MVKKLILGTFVPVFMFASLIGCQSAQEKASAAGNAETATIKADSVAVPAATVAATQAVAPKTATVPSTTTKDAVAKPATTSVATPPKAATTTATITDGDIKAGQAAFVNNKCGMCHAVGTFTTPGGLAVKRNLNGVGLERSELWISSFLHKKESINGKVHAKTFTGTEAEIASLSRWLAAQKVAP